MDENRRRIESQLEKSYAKGTKPSPNAVPIAGSFQSTSGGFQTTASRPSQQDTRNESYSSISDLDEDGSKRPKR